MGEIFDCKGVLAICVIFSLFSLFLQTTEEALASCTPLPLTCSLSLTHTHTHTHVSSKYFNVWNVQGFVGEWGD